MSAGADRAQKVDEVLDEVVEAEGALRERHVARIMPIGDVDIMIGQHGVDGGAQQRRECPDKGATSSTRGCAISMSFLKCRSVPNA